MIRFDFSPVSRAESITTQTTARSPFKFIICLRRDEREASVRTTFCALQQWHLLRITFLGGQCRDLWLQEMMHLNLRGSDLASMYLQEVNALIHSAMLIEMVVSSFKKWHPAAGIVVCCPLSCKLAGKETLHTFIRFCTVFVLIVVVDLQLSSLWIQICERMHWASARTQRPFRNSWFGVSHFFQDACCLRLTRFHSNVVPENICCFN